jgi:hypothetical protein
MHAVREPRSGNVHTECIRRIEFRAIPEWHSSGFPTSARSTAFESADCMEKMVPRILFPMRRFAAAGDDDAAAEAFAAWGQGDGGGEMHV